MFGEWQDGSQQPGSGFWVGHEGPEGGGIEEDNSPATTVATRLAVRVL